VSLLQALATIMSVPSDALISWNTSGLMRLAELEALSAGFDADGRQRRLGTTLLNRSLFVALAAEFQRFSRELHDAAVDVHVLAANTGQASLLRRLLAEGRRLDVGNARRSSLGSDFARVGLDLIADLKGMGQKTARRLDKLDLLVDYRNAIGHGDEGRVAILERTSAISSTRSAYRDHRRSLDRLAGTMDSLVSKRLAAVLEIARPW
jgi:hypothetical protein